MAGSVRYKFQGSTIAVVTGFHGSSPSKAITAITKANPAVVSVSAHGFSNGDVVKISDVVGMTELNGGVYIIDNKTTGTFELVDVDSRGYGTYTSGGHVDLAQFSQFCELTNYNRQGGTTPEIDATTLCSTAKEYELGLPDFGTTQLGYLWAPRNALQTALHDAFTAGDEIAVKIVLPKSGGTAVQLAFVQQESETVAVGGIWTAQTTLKNTGNRADFA
jgi:hypothetical protein